MSDEEDEVEMISPTSTPAKAVPAEENDKTDDDEVKVVCEEPSSGLRRSSRASTKVIPFMFTPTTRTSRSSTTDKRKKSKRDTSDSESSSSEESSLSDSDSSSSPSRKKKRKSKGRSRKPPPKKRNSEKGSSSSSKSKGSSSTNGGSAKGKKGTLLSFFKVDDKKDPKKEQERRERNEFLYSGVPDVVVKAQQFVEKKKVEDEYLSTVQLFPRIQSTAEVDDQGQSLIEDATPWPSSFPMSVLEDHEDEAENHLSSIQKKSSFFELSLDKLFGQYEMSQKEISNRRRICCNSIASYVVSEDDLAMCASGGSTPWVAECDISLPKKLCCDREAVDKLAAWLKLWKNDIKDDGGKSRKIELKRKRGLDDDFVTSEEEEEEFKKKSVLLIGPPGCGKTKSVYVIAEHYGFQVVEVNFSSRRSGKDVLQNVEEAVKSHAVKSKKNCLLLFEDIDLVDPKEDEGFHSAVAQLITGAVRPIVMTTSASYGQLNLDSKLERKEALEIHFTYPKPSQLVKQVLLPLVMKKSSFQDVEEESPLKKKLTGLLESVSRHGKGDIRQLINQIQFLFTFPPSFNNVKSSLVHQHSTHDFSLLDFNFVRPSSASAQDTDCDNDEDEDKVRFSAKARKRQCLKNLTSASEMLSHLCDLDLLCPPNSRNENDEWHAQIHRMKMNYADPNFCNSFILCGDKDRLESFQSLVVDTDLEVEREQTGYKLYDEIGEYCDNVYAPGGWECVATVRTIIKRNKLDSVSRLVKRNGRVTSYFNRLNSSFVSRVCETLGFGQDLTEAQEVVKNVSF